MYFMEDVHARSQLHKRGWGDLSGLVCVSMAQVQITGQMIHCR